MTLGGGGAENEWTCPRGGAEVCRCAAVEWEEVIRHGPLRGRLGVSEIRNEEQKEGNLDMPCTHTYSCDLDTRTKCAQDRQSIRTGCSLRRGRRCLHWTGQGERGSRVRPAIGCATPMWMEGTQSNFIALSPLATQHQPSVPAGWLTLNPAKAECNHFAASPKCLSTGDPSFARSPAPPACPPAPPALPILHVSHPFPNRVVGISVRARARALRRRGGRPFIPYPPP